MPDEEPGSRASYIIICGGRINVLNAKGVGEKIAAASNCGCALTSYLGIVHGALLTDADTRPISDIQHYLMEHFDSIVKTEAEQRIAELFHLFDELEEKFEY